MLRAARALLVAAGLTLAGPPRARAQAFDGSQSIDAYTGLAAGGGRVVGLGGAFVGVAERLQGAPLNPASVAQRRRDLRRGWDLDGAFSGFVLDARQDLDNDGSRDVGLAGRTHLEVGGGGQLGRLGLGLVARTWLTSGPRSAEGAAGIQTSDVSLCGGWSGWSDALVLGASATLSAGAVILYRPDGKEERRLEYAATALRLGALWRPRGVPARLGAVWDPGARARAKPGEASTFPAAAPHAFAFPWTVALGVSGWLGPNAARYNEPSLRELEQHPELGDGHPFTEGRWAPVLVSLQLDLVGPVADAVTVAAPCGRTARRSAPASGRAWCRAPAWSGRRSGAGSAPAPATTWSRRAPAPAPARTAPSAARSGSRSGRGTCRSG